MFIREDYFNPDVYPLVLTVQGLVVFVHRENATKNSYNFINIKIY